MPESNQRPSASLPPTPEHLSSGVREGERVTALVVDGGTFPRNRAERLAAFTDRVHVIADQGLAELLRAAGTEVTVWEGPDADISYAIRQSAARDISLLVVGQPADANQFLHDLMTAARIEMLAGQAAIAIHVVKPDAPMTGKVLTVSGSPHFSGLALCFGASFASRLDLDLTLLGPTQVQLDPAAPELVELAKALGLGVEPAVSTDPDPIGWARAHSADFTFIVHAIRHAEFKKSKRTGEHDILDATSTNARDALALLTDCVSDVVLIVDGMRTSDSSAMSAGAARRAASAILGLSVVAASVSPAAAAPPRHAPSASIAVTSSTPKQTPTPLLADPDAGPQIISSFMQRVIPLPPDSPFTEVSVLSTMEEVVQMPYATWPHPPLNPAAKPKPTGAIAVPKPPGRLTPAQIKAKAAAAKTAAAKATAAKTAAAKSASARAVSAKSAAAAKAAAAKAAAAKAAAAKRSTAYHQ